MEGPGFVFNRSVLKKVAPHIEHCLLKAPKSLMHEDTDLGHGVYKAKGEFPTPSAYEVSC